MRFIRERLTVRLTLTMLLVSLGPLLLAALVVQRVIESSLQAQVEARQFQLATVSSRYVKDQLTQAQEKLKSIAAILGDQPPQKGGQSSGNYGSKAQLRDLSREEQLERLNRFIEPRDLFASMAFDWEGNAQQEVQVAQSGLSENQTKYVQSWYTQNRASPRNDLTACVRDGKDYVGKQLLGGGEVEGLFFLPMAVPVSEAAGKGGTPYLSATLDFRRILESLQSFAAREAGPQGRVIRLVDGRGNLLMESGPQPEDPFETSRMVGHADWRVVVSEPRAQAFAPLAQVRMQALAWAGGSGALAFLLSLLMAARILRPIRRLTAAADAMKGGALGTRSGIEREDEIGRLAASFDRMASSLQQLDQLKSEFVAHVSHELRTPLTAMQLSVANLQDGVAGPVGEKQKEVLGRIQADIDRLIRMVNEVLDIARIEAGRMEIAHDVVDLADVARDAVGRLEPLARQKSVTVSVEASPFTLRGDRGKLHQVVTNLVDNAVKFTPSGGRVDVEVKPGVLRVRDTGAGIPADLQASVFERFARAGAVNAGAGLGLSITKKIVELHGGSISLESEPGRGTTFTVTWPCPDSSS